MFSRRPASRFSFAFASAECFAERLAISTSVVRNFELPFVTDKRFPCSVTKQTASYTIFTVSLLLADINMFVIDILYLCVHCLLFTVRTR